MSSRLSGTCDAEGHVVTAGVPANQVEDNVEDLVAGEEWYFDQAQSHLFASTGVRNDQLDDGALYYREFHVEYAFTKHLGGPFSIELQGRHRYRYEQDQNVNAYWNEGENYTALKIAPKWVITQGTEVLRRSTPGQPTPYVERADPLPDHRGLEREARRRRAARRASVRERGLQALSRLRGGAGRGDGQVLTKIDRHLGRIRGSSPSIRWEHEHFPVAELSRPVARLCPLSSADSRQVPSSPGALRRGGGRGAGSVSSFVEVGNRRGARGGSGARRRAGGDARTGTWPGLLSNLHTLGDRRAPSTETGSGAGGGSRSYAVRGGARGAGGSAGRHRVARPVGAR